MTTLAGKTLFITGSSRGIGREIALRAARDGANVVITGKTAEPHPRLAGTVHSVAAEVEQAGGKALALQLDVRDEQAIADGVKRAADAFGGIDILVNAAGGNVARARSDDRPVFDVPTDAFEEVVRLNLQGTVRPSMCFGEAMGRQRSGVILNISSMAADRAISGTLGYAIAKAGVDSFTRWMAVEMARRYGEGVRVNAIAPGFFIADQNRGVLLNADGSFTTRALTIIAHTPMGRFGRPDELNAAVQYLCSDSASFVTGVVLPVDGGFSAFSGV